MSEHTLDLAKWRSELIKQHNELADCPRLTREEYSHAKMLQRWISQLTAAQSRVKELERVLASAGDYQKWQNEIQRLTADNARLRESIQSVLCYASLPQRYRDELEAAIERPHDAT